MDDSSTKKKRSYRHVHVILSTVFQVFRFRHETLAEASSTVPHEQGWWTEWPSVASTLHQLQVQPPTYSKFTAIHKQVLCGPHTLWMQHCIDFCVWIESSFRHCAGAVKLVQASLRARKDRESSFHRCWGLVKLV